MDDYLNSGKTKEEIIEIAMKVNEILNRVAKSIQISILIQVSLQTLTPNQNYIKYGSKSPGNYQKKEY